MGDMSLNVYFQFLDSQNTFSSNGTPTSLKMLPNHGRIYRFNTKFNKNSGEK